MHKSMLPAVALPFVMAALSFTPAVSRAADSADRPFMEEIVVTGSRVQRADLTGSSPVAVVAAEDLEALGTVHVEEYLRDLPQFAAAEGANITSRNPGAATLDLRNLGENRTLVVVDGKRFVPYSADGVVDVNMIPQALVERVEIVTGGASAVYGSDAIAGVVNFVLDDEFSGLEIDTQYGAAGEGDGNRVQVALTAGTGIGDDRGNVVFSLGYTESEEILAKDRDFSSVGLGNDLEPDFSSFDLDGRIGSFGFTPDGDLEPAVSDFDFLPFTFIQVPQERWTSTALVSYDVTDSVEAYSRFTFVDSETDTARGPTATFGFAPVRLNADNPFLSDAAQAQLLGALGDPDGDGVLLLPEFRRRLAELGPRAVNYDNTAFQLVGGLRGDLPNGMYWDVFAQHGDTDRQSEYNNDVDSVKRQQGILVEEVGGEIVCIDQSRGCVPTNVFGRGNLSQEAADFIRINLSAVEETTQFVTGGSLGGDLPFSMPGTDSAPAWVVGFEYREEETETRPDASFRDGRQSGYGSVLPIEAGIEVTEGFVELKVPLLADAAMAESMTLEFGARQSEYTNNVDTNDSSASNDISSTALKVGGDWQINESLRLRALYQSAVRAPNLAEIGSPRSVNPFGGFASADPCAGAAPVGDARLSDLCVQTGVPTGQIGLVPAPGSNEINNTTGGNPFLEEESSDTYTVGFVYEPQAAERLSVIVDYYQIELEDAVTAVSESVVLDACYGQGQSSFCDRISRNPLDGSLFGGANTGGVDVSLINAARVEVRGVDLAARYDVGLGDRGDVTLNLALTHVLETTRQNSADTGAVDCAGLVGNICARPTHEWRWIQTTDWSLGPWSAQLRWQFLSEIEQDAIELRGVDPSNFGRPSIGSEHYFDLTGGYRVSEAVKLRAGITNLLDNEPPVVGVNYGVGGPNEMNTYPAVYDPVGRSFFIGLKAQL